MSLTPPTPDEDADLRAKLAVIGAHAPSFRRPISWSITRKRGVSRPLLAAAAVVTVAGLGTTIALTAGGADRSDQTDQAAGVATTGPTGTGEQLTDAPRTPVRRVIAGVEGRSSITVETVDDLRKKSSIVLGTVVAARHGSGSGVADDTLLPNLLTVRINQQLNGTQVPNEIVLWVQYTSGDTGIVGSDSQPWLEPGDDVLIGLIPKPGANGIYGAVGPQAIYRFSNDRIAVPGNGEFREPLFDIFDGLTKKQVVEKLR